jgi:hypothetical protein
MNQHDALKFAQISMKENKRVLDSLGDEKTIKLVKNPDEDLIDKLLSLMPKSAEGKILALAAALLFGYILLKSK